MLRPRLRTVTLWTGTLLSLLIVAAFVVSGWWMLGLQIPTPYGPAVVVNEGVLGVMLDDDWYSPGLVVVPRGQPSPSGSGPRRPSWRWWMNWSVGWRYSHVPLYAVFAAVAIPTLLVWRFWPKPLKAGHCRCGYNLKGLTEPRCPECGQPFEAKGDAA